MRIHETAPIFDEVLDGFAPNENWNSLLNSAREHTYKPAQVLGYYAASLAIERVGYADFGKLEQDLIDYAQPPMSPEEVKDFQDAFGRMWALEDAFVTAGHAQPRKGITV